MRRIQVNIDRLVLRGFEPLEGKALAQALEAQLSEALGERSMRGDWGQSRSVPALRLGRVQLEAGAGGARKFGRQAASAVARGLKP
jgi:hypothetical protein